MITILIVAFILIGFFILLILFYNGFIAKRNRVEEALSGIDVILKKRFDMIPNLIQTVKGYASHESQTLENIVSLRNREGAPQSNDENIKLDKTVSQSVNKIFALAENYPDLKANTNFLSLQNELAEIETEIERSKRYFNATVRDYNTAVESFPGNIIAISFGFSKKNYLDLDDPTHRDTPTVLF